MENVNPSRTLRLHDRTNEIDSTWVYAGVWLKVLGVTQ